MWNFKNLYGLFNGKNAHLLTKGLWGIEKEALRVDDNAHLATSEHPTIFDRRFITRDFSESQLEFVTMPYDSIIKTFDALKATQSFANDNIQDEYLWPLSMPCILPKDEDIQVAKFSKLHDEESEIYRRGLALRYGKKMQMISGIHYNYSFSSSLIHLLQKNYQSNTNIRVFQDNLYFHLARNFLRYRWLLIYLFGASPDADISYKENMIKELKTINEACILCSDINDYEKYATSLRVSRYGYSTEIQKDLKISYNSLIEYAKDLQQAISIKSEEYAKFGLFKDNQQIQMNTNVLQKENEYYSPIRFKNTKTVNSQLEALNKYGVEYLELRIFDMNPFEEYGLSLHQLHFVHLFILYCLFEQSDEMTPEEMKKTNDNHHFVAILGRKDNLDLHCKDGKRNIKLVLNDVMNKIGKIAHLLGGVYVEAFHLEVEKIENKDLLPSSAIKTEMNKYKESFVEFGMRKAKEYKKEKYATV